MSGRRRLNPGQAPLAANVGPSREAWAWLGVGRAATLRISAAAAVVNREATIGL